MIAILHLKDYGLCVANRIVGIHDVIDQNKEVIKQTFTWLCKALCTLSSAKQSLDLILSLGS